MKADMVKAIVAMSERNRFSKGIFGWIGFRTYWLPYCKCQFKNVGFLSYKNVGNHTFLYDIFVLAFLRHI